MCKSILQEKSFQFAISGVTLYKTVAKLFDDFYNGLNVLIGMGSIAISNLEVLLPLVPFYWKVQK